MWIESLICAYRGALVAKKTITAGHLPLVLTAKLITMMLNDVFTVKEVKCHYLKLYLTFKVNYYKIAGVALE